MMTHKAKELSETIDRLYWAGKKDREIDAALGLRLGTAARWRRSTDNPPNGVPGRTHGVYTITNGLKTVTGTAPVCAEAFGISVPSFYHMVHRARHGKVKKYAVLMEVVA